MFFNPKIFLAFKESSVFYEIGYSNDNCLLLSIDGEKYLFTDGRYTQEAKESISNCDVAETRDLVGAAAGLLRSRRIKKVALDSSEWNIDSFERFQKRFGSYVFKKPGFLARKRIVKRQDEIEILQRAAAEGAAAFDEFAVRLASFADTSEKRAAYEATRILTKEGLRHTSFDPIVAFNANAALPHAKPGDTTLRIGDTVLFDAGVKVDGYCSDRTRTALFSDDFSWRGDQKFKDSEIQKVYDTVRSAQQLAIESVKEGLVASELDKVAREYISKAGYGKYFVHSLGHGVGIEIHELPVISAKSRDVLEENMVFTIEPGIYIPNFVGVRIEDTVVIRGGRAEILG